MFRRAAPQSTESPSTPPQTPTQTRDKEAEVTALWLQFVIGTSDGSSETIERPIFDRIGFTARTAGQATSAALAPLDVARGKHASLLTVWSVATWTGERVVPASLDPRMVDRRKIAGPGDLRWVLENLGVAHRNYYGLRQTLLDTIDPAAGTGLVTKSANVSLVSWTVVPQRITGGTLAIDLLDNRVSQLPSSGGVALARIVWAEASLQAERAIALGHNFLLENARNAVEAVISDVASVFALSRQHRISLMILRPGDAGRIRTIAASDEARARLKERLIGGYIVLVPEQAVQLGDRRQIGWWMIDKSGFLLDEMEDGRHGQPENALMNMQSKDKVAVEEEASHRPILRGIACVASAVMLFLDVAIAVHDARTGNVADEETAMNDVTDLEDATEECGEEVPSPPTGIGGAEPPLPDSAGSGPGFKWDLPDEYAKYGEYHPPRFKNPGKILK